MDVIWSLFRAIFYIMLSIAAAYAKKSGNELLMSVLSGVLYAEMLTWIIFTVLDITEHVFRSSIDLILNAAAAYYIIGFLDIELPKCLDFEAVSFLSFLAVIGVKIFFRKIISITQE